MTTERIASLLNAKTALAQEYGRLAVTAKSRPKRKTLIHRAERYRHQAEQLSKLQEATGVSDPD